MLKLNPSTSNYDCVLKQSIERSAHILTRGRQSEYYTLLTNMFVKRKLEHTQRQVHTKARRDAEKEQPASNWPPEILGERLQRKLVLQSQGS